jgi:uncharacterized protein (TIGR00725 family)
MRTGETSSAQPRIAGMALKVGVMGGAGRNIPRRYLKLAHALGRAFARRGCALVTGACPGLPLAAAGGAKREQGLVIGISPGLSLEEHLFKYDSPVDWHDVIIYTGSGLMGREVVNIRSSDIVVILGGSSGTLGELAIAYDEGKLIGVLQGTGGISDLVKGILSACRKATGAKVIYERDPERLADRLLQVYRKHHYRHPSCFSSGAGSSADGTAVFRTARDIVCGMWIDPSRGASKLSFEGKRHFFCSRRCAERFSRDPEAFLMGHAGGVRFATPAGAGRRPKKHSRAQNP